MEKKITKNGGKGETPNLCCNNFTPSDRVAMLNLGYIDTQLFFEDAFLCSITIVPTWTISHVVKEALVKSFALKLRIPKWSHPDH